MISSLIVTVKIDVAAVVTAPVTTSFTIITASIRAPSYLQVLLTLTSSCLGRSSLRSASRGDFMVPHARTAIMQHRAFSVVGPSVWNGLPSDLRSLPRDLSSAFYRHLKTYLFDRAWIGSASE